VRIGTACSDSFDDDVITFCVMIGLLVGLKIFVVCELGIIAVLPRNMPRRNEKMTKGFFMLDTSASVRRGYL
jgi:hypothetical protein